MKPLIFDYKISRIEKEDKPQYDYDFHMSLNIVTVNGDRQPFINTTNSNVELETKTKVYREQDDDGFQFEEGVRMGIDATKGNNKKFMQLAMETKTLVFRERDDENFDYYQ